MQKRKFSKIISIITAVALILCSFGTMGIVPAVAAESGLDMQALVDAANIEVSNDTTQDTLNTALQAITLPEGYTYGGITEFHKVNAMDGAVERGSTYMSDPTEEIVLVPGEKGAIAATVKVSDVSYTVTLPIEPVMEVYSFTKLSNSINDWGGDATNGYYLKSWQADKIIVPDEVTKFSKTNWVGDNGGTDKCIVYGKGRTVIPRLDWSNAEVVVFEGDVTTISGLAFYGNSKLKYIRLPDTVTSLGSQAFNHAGNLKYLYLPEGLTTIGSNILGATTYNFDEIIIPSTVTKLGSTPFSTPAGATTITCLSNDSQPGFGIFDHENITFRVPNSNQAAVKYWTGNKLVLEDAITLTEAAARAAKAVYNKGDKVYKTADEINSASDGLLTEIKNAFFNVSTITAAWKNAEWTKNLNDWNNTLVLTKGDVTVEVAVTMSADFDFEKIVKNSVEVSNDTSSETLLADIEALKTTGELPENCTIEINDFYKVNAFNGAIERGSTYPNAPIEDVVLVEGKPGSVAANITITSGSETIYSATVTLKIEPEMAIYSFATVSNTIKDWATYEDAYYYTGGAVDKLVVPDEITNLLSSYGTEANGWKKWHMSKDITCVVFGTGITTVPLQTGLKAEVVSFKGEVTEIGNSAFHSAANLKYIRLPDTVTSIGVQAFRKCSNLTQLYLPEGLTTIGGDLFAVAGQDTVNIYNIDEIIIPSTVTNIGSGAFTGAASPVTITVNTTKASVSSYSVFYVKQEGVADEEQPYKFMAENITVRAWANNAAYVYWYTVTDKKEISADVTLTEATARAAAKAYDYSDVYYETADAAAADADAMLAEIKAAYFGLSKYTLSWKDSAWVQNLGAWENTLVITDGTYTNEIVVGTKAEFDLAKAISEADIKVDNNTTEEVYAQALKTAGVAPEDSTITFDDYYKLNAFNGAVEVDAEDNVTETLVEGDRGYMAAVVTVTSSTGSSVTANVTYVIEPTYEKYYFNGVSNSIDDWEGNETDGWYFKGWAQKIIIPAEVTKFQGTNWLSNNGSNTKCIVYSEHITTIPALHWSSVEVVVFKGAVTEFASQAFYNAKNLKYAKMPDTVTRIGADLFRGNTAMEQLYLSKNLERIEGVIFRSTSESATHKVTQITIPASVTYIAANVFAGAGQECEITVLTKSHDFYSVTPFYNESYPESGKNNIVRVFADSHEHSADGNFTVAEGNKRYLEKISVAEATARAMQSANTQLGDYAENLASINTQQAKIMATVAAGYFDAGTISAEWAEDWNLSGSILTNSIELTDGKNTFTVPVSVAAKAGYYAGAATILTSSEFATNNNKQGLRMYYYFDSSSADMISIDGTEYAIKDFGVITKHIDNTFAGAEDSMISEDEFVIGTEGISVESGAADTIATLSGTKVHYYTSYIKNVPQGGIDYTFQYRGYITYTDANGADVTVYTDSQIASVQNVFDGVSTNADYSAMNDWFDGLVLS